LPLAHLRQALSSDIDGLPDTELLDRFARYADHPAFEVLVRRHGPMVLGVCRRVLGGADADDAFQAVFLVLIRKARGLRRADRLAPWLYGVAYRVALKARAREVRRAAYRNESPDMIPDPTAPTEIPDWVPILDAELDALPAKYRDALVLCELQGTSRADAAKALGVPEGTLSSRLARGRALLRRRLLKHGTLLPTGGLAALFTASGVGRATVPQALQLRTYELVKAATGAAPAGVVPVGAARLADEVLRSMFLTKLRGAGGVVAVLLLATVGLAASTAWPGELAGTPPQEKSDSKRSANLVALPPPGAAPRALEPPAMALPLAPEMFLVPFVDSGTVLSDRDAVQGFWVLEKVDPGSRAKPEEQKDAQDMVGKTSILVAGDVWWWVSANSREGCVSPAPAKLHPTKNPKWLDLFNTMAANDPPKRCIYELDGDTLRICTSSSWTTRPAVFSSDDGDELMVMQFRRGKLPPAVGQKALLGSWIGEPVYINQGQGLPRRTFTPRIEILDGYLFVCIQPGSAEEWIGGKYTVDLTKNPKWVDVELVAPYSAEKLTRLYGSYEVTDGQLKLVLGTKRATRPLEFKKEQGVFLFQTKRTREPVDAPSQAPTPRPKSESPPME
jgi:RNA polymerase sigma factor (sigma-70 family)